VLQTSFTLRVVIKFTVWARHLNHKRKCQRRRRRRRVPRLLRRALLGRPRDRPLDITRRPGLGRRSIAFASGATTCLKWRWIITKRSTARPAIKA